MVYFVIILASLLLSAFFSGMEIAFVSANKLKIELDKKQHTTSSKIIAFFIDRPSVYIATMLIGNNIALVIYGMVMAIVLEPAIAYIVDSEIIILLLQTLISTLIILVTAEFLPKTIFRLNPNFVLKIFALPVFFFYIVFYPITLLSVSLSNNFLKTLFNINIKKNNPQTAFSKVDLDNLINTHSSGSEDNTEDEIENELKIFQNALDFSNIKLRECIIPRTEIAGIDINDNIENLKQCFIETGFSKILIYKETIDNIVGYVHSSDLFKNPKTIKAMMRDIMIVPETMPANKLLADFIKENKSIAVVVDEYGGTSGMVTIEDIIEEITGEIEDEYDMSGTTEKQINDNEYIFSGRLEIDYVNDKYNLNLPTSDEYETIAGLILSHYGSFPEPNQIITIDEIGTFKILNVSKTKIELINLKV